MKQVFMDTNVVIDFLANRQPFAMDAAKLFDLAVSGKVRIFIAAVSYNNIYYILRQSMPANATLTLLEELADMTEITDVTNAVIRQSLKTDFKDYEDAIQYHSALSIPDLDLLLLEIPKTLKRVSLLFLHRLKLWLA
jgi:predicted nucleic acid-binding protein